MSRRRSRLIYALICFSMLASAISTIVSVVTAALFPVPGIPFAWRWGVEAALLDCLFGIVGGLLTPDDAWDEDPSE